MQFRVFEPGIEVAGQSLIAIVDAFKLFPSVALNLMHKHGIGAMQPDRQIVIDPAGWYPQDSGLAAFEAIAHAVGNTSLFDIGQAVPRNAKFPPTVRDIHSAIQSVDIAYHMNHRKNGRVMFEPASGTMLEGIGHYGYQGKKGERLIVSVCENPYPCDFDRGLLTALAQRFEPHALVAHAEGTCRKRGGRSCTYHITW